MFRGFFFFFTFFINAMKQNLEAQTFIMQWDHSVLPAELELPFAILLNAHEQFYHLEDYH